MFDWSEVRDVQRRLSAALAAHSDVGEAEAVEAIRALEALVCAATAAQAALAVELDAAQRRSEEVRGVAAARQGRGVAAQVALARRESPHRGLRHLGLAKVVLAELPHTWAAWRSGRITEWRATLIARETACLTRADRAAVDAAVAGDADHLEQLGDRELVNACRRLAYELDPGSSVARSRRAETERHVSLRPAPDTMTWLTALLPVADGVAAYAALTRAAATARSAGDPRSRDQVMADTLRDALVGAQPGSPAGGAAVALELVMTDAALFGTSEEPAHLMGHGALPAELAREIVARACTQPETVWLRRLYTAPETGELVAMDSRARCFPEGLARFIRLRDQVCRTPWCDAPIRHLDHARPYAAGGATSAINGQGLCEACNHAKQAPGWHARPSPGSSGHHVTIVTPTGHVYGSSPPIVATIRETALRLDYVLAG